MCFLKTKYCNLVPPEAAWLERAGPAGRRSAVRGEGVRANPAGGRWPVMAGAHTGGSAGGAVSPCGCQEKRVRQAGRTGLEPKGPGIMGARDSQIRGMAAAPHRRRSSRRGRCSGGLQAAIRVLGSPKSPVGLATSRNKPTVRSRCPRRAEGRDVRHQLAAVLSCTPCGGDA